MRGNVARADASTNMSGKPGGAARQRLAVQLVFRFGEEVLRTGPAQGRAWPVPIEHEAEPDCDCLLIEEHLSRCVLAGRS